MKRLENTLNNIDDLLGKYLAGEASEKERVVVHDWLALSETNRNYFDQLKMIFEKAAHVPQSMDFNTDLAWEKVKSNLRKSTPVIPIQRKSNVLWYRMAAAVLVLFLAAIYFFKSNDDGTAILPKEFVAEKTSVKDTLPGGTNIFLNKKTKLLYAFDDKTKTHEVKLAGEAYFKVKHSQREEFLIDAGGVFIRDIGTSFNVKAYPGQDQVEVLVEEGEIAFFTSNNEGIHLTAGGKGVYDKKKNTFAIEPPDANITAYKTRFFVFEKRSLGTIVEDLNNVYDNQIVIDDKLRNCELTVSFKDETIEEIANVIAETLALKVRTDDDKIFLEGEGCD